jgi:YVTN family beta-propeller protein
MNRTRMLVPVATLAALLALAIPALAAPQRIFLSDSSEDSTASFALRPGASLPTTSIVPSGRFAGHNGSSYYGTNDSLYLSLATFDRPSGPCQPSGWTLQNIASSDVYAHVSDRFLVNGMTLYDASTMNMGSKALWFGADSSSAPELVKDWQYGTGYGLYWSHRLASPPFSRSAHPNAALTCDVNLAQNASSTLSRSVTGSQNFFFAVQGLQADGNWGFLTFRYMPRAPEAQGFTTDAHTLLLLHFNGSAEGAAGETPTALSGVSYEAGRFGEGAYLSATNQLTYAAAGNFDATIGTLELWIKPRWSGSDGLDHYLLRQGLTGGALFGKDGGNYLRSIFNRFGPLGPEIGVGRYITTWTANQWHHLAYTWGPTKLELFIDGQLVASAVPAISPPVVSDPTLQLGADGTAGYLNAVVDELRISDVQRSADEILADYQRGAASALVPDTAHVVRNTAIFRCEVHLGADGNESISLAEPTRLRIVAQPMSRTEGSPFWLFGAVVDNLVLDDGGTAVLPTVNFEDGTLGGWTLSAVHGRTQGQSTDPPFTHEAAPGTRAAVTSGFDYNDPTCVWTCLSPGDTLARGANFRLVSPWMSCHTAEIYLQYALKGPSGRVTWGTTGRWKQAGEARPRPGNLTGVWVNPLYGSDAEAPYYSMLDQIPADILGARGDSVQAILELTDRETLAYPFPNGSKLPFFDDLAVIEIGVDRDHDGVPDAEDACPDVQAAGQDADGDGCVDAFATMKHVEYWPAGRAIRFAISQEGDPANVDGSDITALEQAFATWAAVPGADLEFAERPLTAQKDVSAADGVNLLTFEDSHVELPPNTCAQTFTLTLTQRGAYSDTMGLPGQLLDADIVFNRNMKFRTPTYDPGTHGIDLESVAIHEIGHLLGLDHSGVCGSTMFPLLQPGSGATSLELDDQSTLVAAFPGSGFGTAWSAYGAIRGHVTSGRTGAAVPGALVTAVRLSGGAPLDTVASDYTSEEGNYALLRLPPGQYAIRITPLDGDVGGFPFTPHVVGPRLELCASTDFSPEWWDEAEGRAEAGDARGAVSVSAGTTVGAIDLVTNVDTVPPEVLAANPADGTTGVRIDGTVLVQFSEAVNDSSLGNAFSFKVAGTGVRVPVDAELVDHGRTLVVSPRQSLQFGTAYRVAVSTVLTDIQHNPMAAPFAAQFETESRPAVAVTAIEPGAASVGSLVEVVGAGFGAEAGDVNAVLFPACEGCAPIAVAPSRVSPSVMVAEVPVGAASGELRVVVNGDSSNSLAFTVLAPLARVAPSLTTEFVLPTDFRPSDVAIAPDARTLYAVGAGGFATVNLDEARPDFRVPKTTSVTGLGRLALSPDGSLAYATRRDSGDVVVLDADPLSGTFRQIRVVVPLSDGAAPAGIALTGNGRRAYVPDAYADMLYELDTEASSATRYRLLRELHDANTTLTGGVALGPGSTWLYFTSADGGGRALDLADTARTVSQVHGEPGALNAAVMSNGLELLLAGGGTGGNNLLWSRLTGPTMSGAVALGGEVRDVAVSPRGQMAYVANATFDRLQVVDLDPVSPNDHTKVAETSTGSRPVAVAVSADGALIGVANEGSNSIGLYGTGSEAQIVRVTPAVGMPGDQVAVVFTTGFDPTGVRFDVGEGAFAAARTIVAGSAASFTVPTSKQRQASLTALETDGSPTLAVPFRLVDRIESLSPRATGIVPGPSATPCGGGSTVGRMEWVRSSHDGQVLAVGRERDCDVLLDLYRTSAAAPGTFGSLLATVTLSGTPATLRGLDFTPDDGAVWASVGEGIVIVAADPASAGFGGTTPLAVTPGETPGPVRADPMGRFMLVAQGGNLLGLWSPATRTRAASVVLPEAARSIAVAPDGARAVVGHEARASVVDLDAAALVTTTPAHPATPTNAVRSIAITADGRQALGVFDRGSIAVWNLAADAGAIGTERYFGAPITTGAPSQAIAAPDGDGVLVGCSDCTKLFELEPSATPPTLTSAEVGTSSRSLERSPDGRLLWAGGWDETGATGQVTLLALGEVAGLELESGGGQVAAAGSALPVPVRVRLTSADAHAREGVPVRFTLAQPDGSLDGTGQAAVRLTDANGEAGVTWTLGAEPGPAELDIEVPGFPTLGARASAVATGDEAVVLPEVVEFGLPEGATNINSTTGFYVRFNQPVVAGSLFGVATLYENSTSWGLSVADSSSDRRGVFLQTQSIPFSSACVLTIGAGVLDVDGQRGVKADSVHFTIQPQPTLSLTAVTPPATQRGAPVVLAGHGFSTIAAQNVVLFGDKIAYVTHATESALNVNVPTGLADGPCALTVARSGAVSNAVTFTVPLPPMFGKVHEDVPAQPGVSRMAISPDGRYVYVTNPDLNTVSVVQLSPPAMVTTITAGYKPAGIAIVPETRSAYVANSAGGTLSMIDVNPASASYNRVVSTVEVGGHPVEIAVSGLGPEIVVLDGGSSGTVSFVDASRDNGTFNRVVATATTGSGGRAVVVSPDGTHSFVLTAGGQVVEIDMTSRSVVATTSVASGGKAIAISPDGAALFVLTPTGEVLVMDVDENSSSHNRVVATATVGSGGKAVVVSPDGTTAVVTSGTFVQVLKITTMQPSGASEFTPGSAIELVPQQSLAVAQAPGAIVLDPTGRYQAVLDEGTGNVVVLRPPMTTVHAEAGADACITPSTPHVVLPLVAGHEDTAAVRGFSVTFTLSSNLALRAGASSIVEGDYLSGSVPGASTLFMKRQNRDGSWTVDGTLMGGACGARAASGTLFTIDVGSTGPDGPGGVTVKRFLLRDCENDSLNTVIGSPAAIAVALVSPTVPALTVAKETGAPLGYPTTPLAISWPAVPSGSTVEIYRAGFGHYPAYDGAGGAEPAVPGYPPDSTWTLVGAVQDASTFVDNLGSRDAWYYVAFARDACGNVSPVSVRTSGTLDYTLGDVTNGVVRGAGDGTVTLADVSLLGAHYSARVAPGDSVAYLDVGPTTTGGVDGRPLTDGKLNFEDMMIFAINFEAVSPAPQAAAEPVAVRDDAFWLEAPEQVVAGGTCRVRVMGRGSGAMQGFSLQLGWDAKVVEWVGVEPAPMVPGQGGVVFGTPAGGVDGALLGAGRGLVGEGEVATAVFRAVANGPPHLRIAGVEARDARNRSLAVATIVRPTVTSLARPRPNPFSGTTTLSFALARGGEVELCVYSVDGRRVRSLQHGGMEPGLYDRTWDGADEQGRPVSPGVYFARLSAPGARITRAIVRVK